MKKIVVFLIAAIASTAMAQNFSSIPVSAPATRDPMKWPFASSSIWNTPIGQNAVYVPAQLPVIPRGNVWAPMPQIDDEIIVMHPSVPTVPIGKSSVAWTGGNRCVPDTPSTVLQSLPIPGGFTVPNSTSNNGAAILSADGRTIVQVQPFTLCTSGQSATSLLSFAPVDLYGAGITGAHGGSGMSSIGGSLRVGELRPGGPPPRHALKINVDSAVVLHPCSVKSDCYHWPAVGADSYANDPKVGYGTTPGGNPPVAMKMGALLAIPNSINIYSIGLETEPGIKLAWTLQNYGAYIVDSTGGAAFAFSAENGPDGSLRTQFLSDWGYPLESRVRDNTPWTRDIGRIVALLSVIDNNALNSIGGGGIPLQPLAPEIYPPQ